MKTPDTDLTRRQFGRLAAGVALAATGLRAGVARAEEPKLVTEYPANKPIIDSLGYVNASTTEGRNCAGCVLYQGPAEGQGKCSLFQQGVVPAAGWCRSWAPKPS